MKVLFIGGTGLISSAVSQLAVQKGIELTLLNRGNKETLVPHGAKVLHGDINNVNEMKALLSGEHFDAVVDFIIFEPAGIERDIELFTGKTNQYIFISTAATYQRPVTQYIIDESTPQHNPGWDYAENKIACEERLIQEYRRNGFPMTIVRPSHTYGPSSIPFAITSWAKPWTIVDRMLRGKAIVVPGDGTSLWTITHNSDFAKGLVGLLGNAQTLGHAFHITSDEVKTWDQYCTIIGQVVGARPKILHIASDAIARFLPDAKGGLLGDTCNSYVLDNSKIKRFVPDYVATTNFETGIRQSIAAFQNHPELMAIDEEFNARIDRLILAYDQFLSKA
jgi:nucleoside-diphosphate-sugar epimerase